eukprot:CAMPEP_0204058106 /NCGR_PEP_ID=MMETSP0360-20130528/135355_1 /ASSEMBLY_ACC=CAM_ASM_000342 /TAXON_ID=268821 /ORGANISM="Scrippsiella Hangoei, Strain SHTV-5" /LENGTH=96 /DNA_ID=CAMNT_0051005625 /DNA_START=8 /DNA_END=294 /DNA_ORIENTATION=+
MAQSLSCRKLLLMSSRVPAPIARGLRCAAKSSVTTSKVRCRTKVGPASESVGGSLPTACVTRPVRILLQTSSFAPSVPPVSFPSKTTVGWRAVACT